jgi:hypothetical protein
MVGDQFGKEAESWQVGENAAKGSRFGSPKFSRKFGLNWPVTQI